MFLFAGSKLAFSVNRIGAFKMEASSGLTEFSLCQIPGKAYDKSATTSIVSSSCASLQLSRFGKSKPDDGTYLDVVLKESILFDEGG